MGLRRGGDQPGILASSCQGLLATKCTVLLLPGCFLCCPADQPLTCQGLDGLLMVHDPAQPQHEAELERLYTSFAQPSRLTTSQCMTIAINLSPGIGVAGLCQD